MAFQRPIAPTDQRPRPAATTSTDQSARRPAPPPESSFTAAPTDEPHPDLGPPACVETDPVEALAAVFADQHPIIGADYQRAIPLPSGRVLWLFQDAFLTTSSGPALVHNVGLLQSGSCFQLLRNGSSDTPTPYLFPDLTEPERRWFWPLGGDIGADDRLHVFVAEMCEHGSRYLHHTEPVATWLATIDPASLAVVDRRPAPDPSADLYGWSVVSHRDHTYLYAHCYRQFGWDPLPFAADPAPQVHDWGCAADVTVARIPRGRFDARPEYWNGRTWTADSHAAVPVFPTEDRSINPVQVGLLDNQYIAVTKVDDWWGDTVHLDVSPAPHGPWRTYATLTVEPRCDDCNTYFASIVPFEADATSFSIALSNNTWPGDVLTHYRPTVLTVPSPANSVSSSVTA